MIAMVSVCPMVPAPIADRARAQHRRPVDVADGDRERLRTSGEAAHVGDGDRHGVVAGLREVRRPTEGAGRGQGRAGRQVARPRRSARLRPDRWRWP